MKIHVALCLLLLFLISSGKCSNDQDEVRCLQEFHELECNMNWSKGLARQADKRSSKRLELLQRARASSFSRRRRSAEEEGSEATTTETNNVEEEEEEEDNSMMEEQFYFSSGIVEDVQIQGKSPEESTETPTTMAEWPIIVKRSVLKSEDENWGKQSACRLFKQAHASLSSRFPTPRKVGCGVEDDDLSIVTVCLYKSTT